MGFFDDVMRAIGRPRLTADEVAIRYAQAMLAGDSDSVTRMTDDSGLEAALALVARFAEADLARWFNRYRSLAAPDDSLSSEARKAGFEEMHFRYVVGRVALPDNAVQDFPIMTVSVGKQHGSWIVVASKPNARLFDDGTGDPPVENDLALEHPTGLDGKR